MIVACNFFSDVKTFTGTAREEFNINGPALSDLFAQLTKKFPGLTGNYFDAQGKPFNILMVVINGRHADISRPETIILHENDNIDLLTAVAGG
ncbi:MAG: MoaD/ThiS family protein [Planctomycetes bacterium]|nr:MoaD/ThiS family protein [Planctomycetota bacterium]